MELWEHRLGQWVIVIHTLGRHGRRSGNSLELLSVFVSERRRTSPTWGLTPRMPVCSVAACSRQFQ
jgi:hypothetical protein